MECCILGTTSLLHHCLQKGASIAFVLRDVGVLLIEGSRVQMRFYLDFLDEVIGERIQDSAMLKVSLCFLSAWAEPEQLPSTAGMCSPGCGQGLWPGRRMIPAAPPALNFSPECLGHIEDVLAPSRCCAAGSPAAGHGGVPGSAHFFPELHRPHHHLSQVSQTPWQLWPLESSGSSFPS